MNLHNAFPFRRLFLVKRNREHSAMQRQKVRGTPPPQRLRDAAAVLVGEIGDREAARALKMARGTLSRVLAGQPLNEGTLALLELHFGRRAS